MIRGMPGGEHAGVRMRNVFTPSASSLCTSIYSHRRATLELCIIERTHCLLPLTGCSHAGHCVCPLTNVIRPCAALHPLQMAYSLPFAGWCIWYRFWYGSCQKTSRILFGHSQWSRRYTTPSVQDHPRSVQMEGVIPWKRSPNCSSCRDRRAYDPGALHLALSGWSRRQDACGVATT